MDNTNIVQEYEKQQEEMREHLITQKEQLETIVFAPNELTYEDYMDVLESYYQRLKEGFEHDWYRHAVIRVRFDIGGEIYNMRYTHFITNAMMWAIQRRIGKSIGEEHIFDASKVNARTLENYINTYIIAPNRKTVKNKKLNIYIHDMMFQLSRISRDFNEIMSLTISAETFIGLSNRLERFNEILGTRISDDMQPAEIENLLDTLTEEQLQVIVNDKEYNDLKPLILSGEGIKSGQFKEFAVNAGLKPDIDGKTIPIPVNTNLLTDGLNNIPNYYIDAKGGRKSLIMNSTVMGDSGYFARQLSLLGGDFRLASEDEPFSEDCGTLHHATLTIVGKSELRRLAGRYYKRFNEREYKVLRETDTHLIGETFQFRTPMYCSTAPTICRTCYGELSHVNEDLNSIGGLAATEHSEPISQNILSSKHMLTTISENIEFNEEAYNYFSLHANEVMITKEKSVEGNLLIKLEDIINIEDPIENGPTKLIHSFYVQTRKGELIEIKELDEKELMIAPELEDIIDGLLSDKRKKIARKNKGYVTVPFGEISHTDRLFLIEISNNELTGPLHDIKDILGKEDTRNKKGIKTPDDMAQELMRLLETSGIGAVSVHTEILISALIRSASDPDLLQRPDFNDYAGIRDIKIMTLQRALINNPSVIVSLSFSRIRSQLHNMTTYKKRESSYLDDFYRVRL